MRRGTRPRRDRERRRTGCDSCECGSSYVAVIRVATSRPRISAAAVTCTPIVNGTDSPLRIGPPGAAQRRVEQPGTAVLAGAAQMQRSPCRLPCGPAGARAGSPRRRPVGHSGLNVHVRAARSPTRSPLMLWATVTRAANSELPGQPGRRRSAAAGGTCAAAVARIEARQRRATAPPRAPARASQAERAGDHDLLHLVGALADRQHLRIAVEAAYRVLLDVTVAAVDLDRLVRDADRERGRS